ncbi:serine/threonine-protein phosphatase 5-like [Sitophilus oryzae]|uniref:Serine/threonine-protein phosphatase 5-like n=1 Tax=Sitophilus oryzae TaxID=7048 RepID=A0A6J2Y067_SITOR|nr:serine/threonine-protein phosphatase 5-like [Sitophilus oryzae]
METSEEEPSVETLKELGNKAVKENKFQEAILHYTHAIKLEGENYTLYSNRSLAFLKIKQYYFAIDDARETINLNPAWPKGYFRKGEVEFATGHYNDAYESYKAALKLKPDDIIILEALNRAAKELIRQTENERKVPWVGAGVGIVIGVTIFIADCLLTMKPTHPILMAVVTIMISLIGYGIAKSYRGYVKNQRAGLLEPPPDLNKEEEEEKSIPEEKEVKRTPRYSRSQARLRYKKGKL